MNSILQSHIYLLGNVQVTIPKHWTFFSLSRWIAISLVRPTKPLLSYNKFGKGKCNLHLNIDYGQRWVQIKDATAISFRGTKGSPILRRFLISSSTADSPSNLASISQENLYRNPNMTMQETITHQKFPSYQINYALIIWSSTR
jgi:hypothetical protein